MDNKNKFFIVYESRFGELTLDCEPTAILGLFNNKEKAIECALENCEENKNNSYGYIYDEELDIEKEKAKDTCNFRMFRRFQENWGDYFETIIEEVKLD